MASLNFTFFLEILLFALFSLLHTSNGVSIETLAKICSKIEDPKECQKILEKDPNTASADLPKLSLISINLTENQSLFNLDTFSKLSQNSTNPLVKEGFVKCTGFYLKIKGKIEEARRLSEQNKFKNTVAVLDQAKKLALDCQLANIVNSLYLEQLSKKELLLSDISLGVNKFIVGEKDV